MVVESVMEALGVSELARMSKRQVSGGEPAIVRVSLTVVGSRQLLYQILNFGMIVSSALMIWKGLMYATGSESPIVVVLR